MPDPRVERFAVEIRRTMGCDLGVARETAVAVLKQLDAASLAVVVKDNFPGPDLVWDIGDSEPPDDIIGVLDYTADGADSEDQDSCTWGRVLNSRGHLLTGPTETLWKSYKNGGKIYLPWAELVRRWGPVRRG